MADQTSHDLKYGHLGQLLYNPTDKAWLSRRVFGSPYALQPLAPSQWALAPILEGAESSSHNQPHRRTSVASSHAPSDRSRPKPSRSVALSIPSLVRQLPTLAPGADLAVSLVHLSQQVTTGIARHDPLVGDLLAFGRVNDRSTRRPLEVAAFPARTSPTLLCLTQVQPQKQGWDHQKGIWIDVSRIGGESGNWHARQPIHQLCFCAMSDESLASTPFLAVRTSIAVHVLRISLRRHPATDSSPHSSTVSSRFLVTPTHTLNLDMLGRVPPADVTFNPHYDKQIATMDQTGTWRIWDLSRQPVGTQGRPLELASGAAADDVVRNPLPEVSRVLDDGWGRVLWGPDTSTIVAASRRAIGLYDVSGKPMRLLSPDLGIAGTAHWILDIKTGPQTHSLVFVLTSVYLFCLRIQSLTRVHPDDFETAGAQIVFRTAHFRDPEDISLRLSTFMDTQGTILEYFRELLRHANCCCRHRRLDQIIPEPRCDLLQVFLCSNLTGSLSFRLRSRHGHATRETIERLRPF